MLSISLTKLNHLRDCAEKLDLEAVCGAVDCNLLDERLQNLRGLAANRRILQRFMQRFDFTPIDLRQVWMQSYWGFGWSCQYQLEFLSAGGKSVETGLQIVAAQTIGNCVDKACEFPLDAGELLLLRGPRRDIASPLAIDTTLPVSART